MTQIHADVARTIKELAAGGRARVETEPLEYVVDVGRARHGFTQRSVIVDLAAQTAAPLARWMRDSDVLALLGSMGVQVNFWHVADAGKDSVDLLDRLINTYGPGPNYFVVKNEGRGSDFSLLDNAPALKKTLAKLTLSWKMSTFC